MKTLEALSRAVSVCQAHHGLATRRALLQAGLNTAHISALVRSGTLVRIHPAVFALAGAGADPKVRIRAALAAVAGAGMDGGYGGAGVVGVAASHGSAAWLQGLIDRPPSLVHVASEGGHRRRLEGVVVHRCAPPLPTLSYQGVRCTTPARTVADLSASAPAERINMLVDRALDLGLVRMQDLAGETGRPGTAALRRSLRELGHLGAPEASVLESELHRLITRYRLPVPKIQVVHGPGGRYRLDCYYEAERLIVEVDGYASHHTPEQMAHDNRRRRELALAGDRILVFTWREVTRQPARVAAQIREALSLPLR